MVAKTSSYFKNARALLHLTHYMIHLVMLTMELLVQPLLLLAATFRGN